MVNKSSEWLLCPVCGNKTRLQIRADTELKNFPLYCPKCKQVSIINAKDMQITIIKKTESNLIMPELSICDCSRTIPYLT
ncbi:MAG: cysteine-rich KTR domain-containing protein [Eubacteriales bacterium]|nr:cysteine-rich KTR domain-containing protein [Eubacteriales bacterium]